MVSQLRFQGLRYRLGLANCIELRQTANEALDAGIYTPSLVDAALDVDERLYEIGAAFEKALAELEIVLPDSKEECCWALLHHHVNQIESGVTKPQPGLKGVMEVYYGCNLYEQSTDYVGDSHDLSELIGAYWGYNDLFKRPQEVTYNDLSGEDAVSAFDSYVVVSCKIWLETHKEIAVRELSFDISKSYWKPCS